MYRGKIKIFVVPKAKALRSCVKCASELFFSKGKEMLTLAWDDRKLRQESTLLRKSKAQMTRPCVRTQSWGRQYPGFCEAGVALQYCINDSQHVPFNKAISERAEIISLITTVTNHRTILPRSQQSQ